MCRFLFALKSSILFWLLILDKLNQCNFQIISQCECKVCYITLKNMINVYKIVQYCQIEECMPYFNSTFAKFFNLIPLTKKVRNFFSL